MHTHAVLPTRKNPRSRPRTKVRYKKDSNRGGGGGAKINPIHLHRSLPSSLPRETVSTLSDPKNPQATKRHSLFIPIPISPAQTNTHESSNPKPPKGPGEEKAGRKHAIR
jgi:hypothetical protein